MRKLIVSFLVFGSTITNCAIFAQSYYDDWDRNQDKRFQIHSNDSFSESLQRQREQMEQQQKDYELEQRIKKLEADVRRSRTGKPDSLYDDWIRDRDI